MARPIHIHLLFIGHVRHNSKSPEHLAQSEQDNSFLLDAKYCPINYAMHAHVFVIKVNIGH